MRKRIFLLVPVLLAGCEPGRQAAVSNDGRVASTVSGGTFVAGRGRIADGGSDVAWSPDGQTLAIAAKDRVILWPKGDEIPDLSGPLSFSPFGDHLAGVSNRHVVERNLITGEVRRTSIEGVPDAIRWTAEGRPMSVDAGSLQIDGVGRFDSKAKDLIDAMIGPDGKVVYIQWEAQPKTAGAFLNLMLRLGSWNPADGTSGTIPIAKVETLFGAPSPRRLTIPESISLAPNGSRMAVAGLRIESSARNIARLRVLADKAKLTDAENKEANDILKAARGTTLVMKVGLTGQAETLWTSPSEGTAWDRIDLAWSPDGAWLAIGQKDGTIRVATGS